MDIETIAVSKIQGMVARCPHLQPLIASNDKTPFTDGHIDLYKTPSPSKLNWIGRVPVQVKGRKAPRRPKKRESFSVTRTDLLGFQHEGGVLYFVVYVDENGNTTPHYVMLAPFKIDHLLSQVPADQASIAIPLEPLPRTPAEIERIVHLALKAQTQNPSLGFDPILFQNIHSITVSTASELNWDAPVTFTPGESDFVLEMKTSSGATVPLSGVLQIFPPDYVEHEIQVAIKSGDFEYRHAIARRISHDTAELDLGGGLCLVLTSAAGKPVKLNVTSHSNFACRYRALGFVVALADSGWMEVNGETLSLGCTANDAEPDAQMAEIREHWALLKKLHDLFEHLGVT